MEGRSTEGWDINLAQGEKSLQAQLPNVPKNALSTLI